MRFQLVDALADCQVPAADALVSVDFLDVPPSNPFHDFVDAVARDGVTSGCGGGGLSVPGRPSPARRWRSFS